jgi:enterochelin esterase family protein
MNRFSRTLIPAAALLAAATAAPSQPPKGEFRKADGPPPVVSPEVGSDRTVTFRLRAPKATEVTGGGDWGRKPMTKDDRGVWSVTVGPLEPDLYTYKFTVDGVPTVDPRNAKLKIGRESLDNLLDVPGDGPRPIDLRPVPHGTLHAHQYQSKALGGKARGLVVYTPPGYEAAADTKYPVLYLLHGSGDDQHGWTNIGKAERILDNLLADGKAVPMIVVMPDGHAAERAGNTKAFEADLIGDILPLVEKTYRVKPGQENRAIAGLSMGGGQSWAVGMAHTDLFAHVCPFSMGGGNAAEVVARLDPAEVNKRLKLIWIGCGRQDRLFAGSEALCGALQAKGIRHTWRPTDGGHTWIVWRKYLAEVVPQLFR